MTIETVLREYDAAKRECEATSGPEHDAAKKRLAEACGRVAEHSSPVLSKPAQAHPPKKEGGADMDTELDSQITQSRNKGKLTGAKPPLRPKHVWAVRTRLQLANRLRDLALFDLAIDSKLRGCDVVALKVVDVAPHGCAVDRASVRQRKTGRPVRFEITEQTRQAIDDYLSQRRGALGTYLFTGRGPAGHLTTRQYARLLAEWLAMIGLDPCFYGTHSLRRTKATLIYKKTGNLRAVQLLLGHTKIESTVRYLGIEVDDALAVAEQIDV
jgi:integrase